jgi:hypothetical protein
VLVLCNVLLHIAVVSGMSLWSTPAVMLHRVGAEITADTVQEILLELVQNITSVDSKT